MYVYTNTHTRAWIRGLLNAKVISEGQSVQSNSVLVDSSSNGNGSGNILSKSGSGVLKQTNSRIVLNERALLAAKADEAEYSRYMREKQRQDMENQLGEQLLDQSTNPNPNSNSNKQQLNELSSSVTARKESGVPISISSSGNTNRRTAGDSHSHCSDSTGRSSSLGSDSSEKYEMHVQSASPIGMNSLINNKLLTCYSMLYIVYIAYYSYVYSVLFIIHCSFLLSFPSIILSLTVARFISPLWAHYDSDEEEEEILKRSTITLGDCQTESMADAQAQAEAEAQAEANMSLNQGIANRSSSSSNSNVNNPMIHTNTNVDDNTIRNSKQSTRVSVARKSLQIGEDYSSGRDDDNASVDRDSDKFVRFGVNHTRFISTNSEKSNDTDVELYHR